MEEEQKRYKIKEIRQNLKNNTIDVTQYGSALIMASACTALMWYLGLGNIIRPGYEIAGAGFSAGAAYLTYLDIRIATQLKEYIGNFVENLKKYHNINNENSKRYKIKKIKKFEIKDGEIIANNAIASVLASAGTALVWYLGLGNIIRPGYEAVGVGFSAAAAYLTYLDVGLISQLKEQIENYIETIKQNKEMRSK